MADQWEESQTKRKTVRVRASVTGLRRAITGWAQRLWGRAGGGGLRRRIGRGLKWGSTWGGGERCL